MANTTTQKDEPRVGMGSADDKLKKAQESGSVAADKAKEAVKATGDAVGQVADAGAAAVGGGLKSLAGQVREQGPHDGALGEATSTVAKGLETGGKYLQKEGITGMADDLGEIIKKNPIPAVLVAVGIGFMLAQLTRS